MISRRGFLRAGVGGALLLGGAALVGRSLGGYRLDATTAGRLRALSPKEYLVLQAVARRVLAPDADDAPSSDAIDVARGADVYVAKLPPPMQDEVRALLQLVEHGSTLFSGGVTRFTRLDGAAQDAVLRDWQTSSLTLRRRGFQALRTLAFIGYYRDDRVWPLLGYSGPMLPKRT